MEAVVGMLNQMRGGGAGGKAIDEVTIHLLLLLFNQSFT
jgi:hypothetical protein